MPVTLIHDRNGGHGCAKVPTRINCKETALPIGVNLSMKPLRNIAFL
jgi:hypothetical protein